MFAESFSNTPSSPFSTNSAVARGSGWRAGHEHIFIASLKAGAQKGVAEVISKSFGQLAAVGERLRLVGGEARARQTKRAAK